MKTKGIMKTYQKLNERLIQLENDLQLEKFITRSHFRKESFERVILG